GGVQAGPAHGARADEVVVALVDPGAAADVRRRERREQLLARIGDGSRRRRRRLGGSRARLDPVARRLLGEESRRDLADQVAVVEAAEERGVRDLADDGMRKLPAAEDVLGPA